MTFESLKEVICATITCDAANVRPDAMLVPDVCADSLDTVELSVALEDKTGVSVPDDLMPTFRTVSDLLSYLNKHGA